jgi:hypothetical protein
MVVPLVAACSTRPAPQARESAIAASPPPAPPMASTVRDASRVDPSPSASSTGSPAPIVAAPRDLPPSRPCAIEISRLTPDPNDECLELDRVRPEGRALSVCFARASRLTFRYDENGRIVESPLAKYTYGPGRTGTRVTGNRTSKLAFDAEGRLVQDGAERLRYDARGRLVRSESGARFLAYVYAPDDTYTTDHNYPDRDEFCVADRVEVVRDSVGRVAKDRYDHCGINETPRTLHYHYGPHDELVSVDVDLHSDATLDATLKLRYECP